MSAPAPLEWEGAKPGRTLLPADAEALAEEFMARFLAGEIRRVMVIATRYHSASLQKPAEIQLLPIALPEIPQGGAEGMLITQGGRFGGYGFYVWKDKPVFLWNLVDLKRVRWEGPDLTPGKHVLEFDFRYDGMGIGTLAFNSLAGVGRGGTGVLKVDGKEVARQSMERTIPFILQWDESMDIGSDTLTGVNDADYQPPFPFTGKLRKVTLAIDRPQLSPADVKKLMEAQRNNKVSE